MSKESQFKFSIPIRFNDINIKTDEENYLHNYLKGMYKLQRI